jgi:hypothetical protein
MINDRIFGSSPVVVNSVSDSTSLLNGKIQSWLPLSAS